jgi:hypothetical protein
VRPCFAVVLVERTLRLDNGSITANTSPHGIFDYDRGGGVLRDSAVTGHQVDLFTRDGRG